MARIVFDIVMQMKLLDYYANNYHTNIVHACFSDLFKFNKIYIEPANKK